MAEKQANSGSWKKGQTGNPKGRPVVPEIAELREALEKVKTEKNMGLLEHFVRRAYVEDNCLIALGKKLLPDKMHVEDDGSISNETLSDIREELKDFFLAIKK
jgi:hypothetical protein